MSNFSDCLTFVLVHEGGSTITDDKNDPGGLTRWGISKRAHPEVDVRHLSRDGAAQIYLADYWQPCKCDKLPKPIALCVFDSAVNAGDKMAIRMLQEALNITDDGVIGPQTVGTANSASIADLVEAFCARREVYYRSLSGFPRYGHGWINRTEACKMLALSWIPKGAPNANPTGS